MELKVLILKGILLLLVNAYCLVAAYRSFKNKSTWISGQLFSYVPQSFEVKGKKAYVFTTVYLIADALLSFLIVIY